MEDLKAKVETVEHDVTFPDKGRGENEKDVENEESKQIEMVVINTREKIPGRE